jgi:hypothetical protein
MPVAQIFDGPLTPNSNNLSEWFQGANYLFFAAPDRPDWSVDGNFTEVDAALLIEVPGDLLRQVPLPLGMVSTREPIVIPSELARSGARMRLLLQVSESVILEGYAVSEASLAATVTELRLREIGSEPPTPREITIDSATGVISVGAAAGPAWRYLPEGFGPTGASVAALQQLADDLEALRDISATDADLEAEIAEIQVAIEAALDTSATDAELATALSPIQAAIDLLSSEDDVTALAIAALQASIANLDATYATDLQLAQIAAQIPTRSATAPTAPSIGARWIELLPSGLDRHPWEWVWVGTEWQSSEVFATGAGSGRISGSASPRADLTFLPRRGGLAGYRLVAADLVCQVSGPSTWTAKVRQFVGAATLTDWLLLTGPITASGVVSFPLPANTLILPTATALELNLTKGTIVADSMFVLSLQWVAVRA